MAELEADCQKHNLYVTQDGETTKIPDLVKALRLREEDNGIRQQEVIDAKNQAFEQAQRLHDAPASGAATIQPSDTQSPPPPQQGMNEQQMLDELQRIKTLATPRERAQAMEKLRPFLAQAGIGVNERK